MKKFRFPLEAVARVRAHEVRREELRLAETGRRRAEARAMRDQARQGLREVLHEAPVGELVDASDFLHWDERRTRAIETVERGEDRLAQWALRFEEDHVGLMRARQREEAVERLRDRRYAEFVRELLRGEQAELDEFAGRADQRRRAA